jgi:hypothetical protein
MQTMNSSGGGGGGAVASSNNVPPSSNPSFAGNVSNKPIVYIENPPMKDLKGKIHTDTKIGTKLDDVW